MRQKRNGSHLILIELMFVLFFFAICGAILLQVFVRAHELSERAKELTQTKNYVTQAAELFEAGYSKLDEYQNYFPEIEEKDGDYETYFDESFHMTKQKDAIYQMTIHITEQGTNQSGKITMLKGKKQIYQLKLFKHLPGGKTNERS